MTLAEPDKLFARFAQDAGTAGGARANFQLLVTDLVKVQRPDATTVEGPGGRDWGIDTFVGQLAGGQVGVWQSKFIDVWLDDTPQKSVRASFKSAIENAAAKGYTLASWTLVVPCILEPGQHKWFTGWASRQRRDHSVAVEIWNGTDLRHQLLRTDAEDVRREYFPHTVAARSAVARHEPVRVTDDLAQFDGTLFLRQLHEAGRTETDSACALFYATEALLSDYAARGQSDALESFDGLNVDIHHEWERHFNNEQPAAEESGRMPRLHDLSLDSAANCENPPGLFLRPAHKKGAVHRLVEGGRAGWVTHWREVAADHAAASTEAGAEQPPVEADGTSNQLNELAVDTTGAP